MRYAERVDARLIGLLVAFATVCAVVASERTPVATAPSPLDPDVRTVLLSRAEGLPRMRSLLVSVDGVLAEEHYYRGATAERAANLKSASKSILSILVAANDGRP